MLKFDWFLLCFSIIRLAFINLTLWSFNCSRYNKAWSFWSKIKEFGVDMGFLEPRYDVSTFTTNAIYWICSMLHTSLRRKCFNAWGYKISGDLIGIKSFNTFSYLPNKERVLWELNISSLSSGAIICSTSKHMRFWDMKYSVYYQYGIHKRFTVL